MNSVQSPPFPFEKESLPCAARIEWADFAEACWEKRPMLFKGYAGDVCLSPGELFRAVTKVGDEFRAEDDSNLPVRVYVEQAQMAADVGGYLPEEGDGSMEGYAARISRKTKGERFALVIEEFQAHDADLWLALREFLRGLYEETGIEVPYAKATLFVGNYWETPFGLHKGSSSNFKFILAGRKKVSLWPDKFFKGRKGVSHTTGSHRFLDSAMTLDGHTGDVVYWPSDCWHTAECVDGVAATLSLALFPKVERTLKRDLWQHAVDAGISTFAHSSNKVNPCRNPTEVRERLQALPRTAELITKNLRDFLLQEESRETLAAMWLNRASAFPFRVVPSPLEMVRLEDEPCVAGNPNYPILWIQSGDDSEEIICSANGHAFAVPAHPRIIELIEELNTGQPAPVQTLIDRYSGTARRGEVEVIADPSDIEHLLEKLYSVRGIASVATS